MDASPLLLETVDLKQASKLPGRKPEHLNFRSPWFVKETNQPKTIQTRMYNNTKNFFLHIFVLPAFELHLGELRVHSCIHERKGKCSKLLNFSGSEHTLSHFC